MFALADYAATRSAVVGGETWIRRADGAWYTLREFRVRGWGTGHLMVWPNQTRPGWTRRCCSSSQRIPPGLEFNDGPDRDAAMLASLRWASA